jgi:hypothetical protein
LIARFAGIIMVQVGHPQHGFTIPKSHGVPLVDVVNGFSRYDIEQRLREFEFRPVVEWLFCRDNVWQKIYDWLGLPTDWSM